MAKSTNTQKEHAQTADEPKSTLPINSKEPTNKNESITYDLSDFRGIADLVRDKGTNIESELWQHIQHLIELFKVDAYKILFIYSQERQISETTADQIYSALSSTDKNKDLLLVINSPGGQIEPAFLLSKCCKEYSRRFIVSVPRKAKSAATLITFGADEIHMGMMSELGPIDPQIGRLPALSLSSALETLAKTVEKYPASYQMLSDYLAKQLDLRTLGYFERVSKSAVQYGERLLEGKTFPNKMPAVAIANQFVYNYQDHGFVIDKEEASHFLGEMVKTDTPEYKFGNECHLFLDKVSFVISVMKKNDLALIGSHFSFWPKVDDE